MEDFPANSAKARARSEGPPQDRPEERPKRVERVTSVAAERRKRGLGRQFKDTFVSGTARGALDYMILEVVVPTVQGMIIDSVQGGFERWIRGDSRPRRGITTSSYSNVGHVDYTRASSGRPPTARTLSQQSRTRHDFGEIVIQSRQQAEEVLDRMYDILSRYGSVSVADLYELTGITSSHTDHKWGWTSLRGAKAKRMRNDEYLLDLPNPEPLDR